MPAVQPVPPFPQTPGDWIHWFRYRLMKNDRERWSRDDLGHELGVSGRTVGRWETGQSEPTESDIENIAAGLRLSDLQAEFLYRAFGRKRIEKAPAPQLLVSKARDLMAPGYPILIMDSLFYIRAWSSYNQLIGFAGAPGQPGVNHVLWQILAAATGPQADAESERRLRSWIRLVWIETASMCGTPAYQHMLSRLLVVPGFRDAWLKMAEADKCDAIFEDEPAEFETPSGRYREFHTQMLLPPNYHVRQFVPVDAAANQSIAALRKVAQPEPKFSRLLHWSDEDRLANFLARRSVLHEPLIGRESDLEERAAIVLFSKQFDCSTCNEAKRFLDANHVIYVEKDVTDQDNLLQLVNQYQFMRVPVLVVKDQTILGFDKEQYEQALGL